MDLGTNATLGTNLGRRRCRGDCQQCCTLDPYTLYHIHIHECVSQRSPLEHRAAPGKSEPKLTMFLNPSNLGIHIAVSNTEGHPMRKSPENLLIVLNSMVDNPKVSIAARKIGVSTMTLYRWLKMSRDGAPEFQDIEWCGERGSFHQFYEYAQHAQINEIEQTAKHNALGFDEVVTHDGAVQYQIDPKLVGMSDEMLEDFGYPDRYLRNERGEVIPLTVKRKPSDALVIKMLSAHKPELYGERSRVDVNMRVGGVLRLQRPDEVVAKTLEQQQDGSFALDDCADEQVTPPT